ncbi:GNAT family N-acetyltransferase [Agrococcus lahaulensis]|nr:GNAT family N-acetyltransferase [Agrococcus lahaulensis]
MVDDEALLLVRPALPGDELGVAQVHVDAWRGAYRGLIADEVLTALSVEVWIGRWRAWLEASSAGLPTDRGPDVTHRMLVATLGDRVVGWATYGQARDATASSDHELAGLYVHPDSWSRGVGHKLLGAVESDLLSLGATDAYLWVLDGNERAIGFYEHHHWTSDGADRLEDAGGARQLRELRHTRALRP